MTEDEYPFTWSKVSEEISAERRKRYTAATTGMLHMVVSRPLDVMLPKRFVEDGIHKAIWNMETRPDDIWIVTFPKSGTTMTQEMVYQIVHGCQLDSDESRTDLNKRSPFLEFKALIPKNNPQLYGDKPWLQNSLEFASSLASPRIIKTHLPISMLPPEARKKSKIVHVVRNPKDVCVSYFYHDKLISIHGLDESASFLDFADFFRRGDVTFGSYWSHLKDCWSHGWRENVKTFRYEDMLQDKKAAIRAMSEFLGLPLPEEKMEALADHLKFDNFKENDAVNKRAKKDSGRSGEEEGKKSFIRKGIVGDWKNHFVTGSEEVLERFEDWCRKNNRREEESGRPIFDDYS